MKRLDATMRFARRTAKLWLRSVAVLALAAGLFGVGAKPLRGQQMSVAEYQRKSAKDAKKQDKLQKKAAKNKTKAQKKASKAQAKQLKKDRKSDAKANRKLHG